MLALKANQHLTLGHSAGSFGDVISLHFTFQMKATYVKWHVHVTVQDVDSELRGWQDCSVSAVTSLHTSCLQFTLLVDGK